MTDKIPPPPMGDPASDTTSARIFALKVLDALICSPDPVDRAELGISLFACGFVAGVASEEAGEYLAALESDGDAHLAPEAATAQMLGMAAALVALLEQIEGADREAARALAGLVRERAERWQTVLAARAGRRGAMH